MERSSGKRLLMEAANGMMVWVPEEKAEAWQQAQQAQKAGARKPDERVISRIASALKGQSR